MPSLNSRVVTALLPLLAAACSTAANYPSLAVRPAERITGHAAPAPSEAPTPASPATTGSDLTDRLGSLVYMARIADRKFEDDRAAAERAIAVSGDNGSDSWSTASIALARLESSRSQAMVALADLDSLYVAARSDPAVMDSPAARAIAAAREQVGHWVATEDEVIARLARRLRN